MPSLFADGLFWTSVACCLVAQVLIIRSVRGARYVPGHSDAMPRQRSGLELAWAVLPAVGLTVLLLFTWRAIRRNVPPVPSAPALPVTSPVTSTA